MFTSTEIRGTQFEVNRKGYNVEDVRAFLNQVAYQFEKLEKEKAELEQNMLVLADKLDEYRREEEKLSAALFNAQKISENIVDEATQKATIIVGDAQIVAENIVNDANATAEAAVSAAAEEAARIINEATSEADAQAKRANDERLAFESVRSNAIEFRTTLLELYNSHLELLGMIDLGENPEIENNAPAFEQDSVDEVLADETPAEAEYDEVAAIESEYDVSEEVAQVIAENDFSFDPAGGEGFSTVEFPKFTESLESDEFTGSFSLDPVVDDGFDTTGFATDEADSIFEAAELDEIYDQAAEEFAEPEVVFEEAPAAEAEEVSAEPQPEPAEEPQAEEVPAEEPAEEIARPVRRTRYARRSVQSGVGLGEARSKDRELKFGSDFSFDI